MYFHYYFAGELAPQPNSKLSGMFKLLAIANVIYFDMVDV